jgi:ATP-dependent Clp protease ATP-binding subunit ClpA
MTVNSVDEMLTLSKRMHPGFSPSFAALELFDDVVPELMKTERTVIDAEDIRSWFKDKSPVEVTGARQVKAELERIEEALSFQVLGQPAAIEEISSVLRTAFAGLRRDDRPLASFVFCGALGSGKTLAAQAIASSLLSDEAFVPIDLTDIRTPVQLEEIIRDALVTPKVLAFNGLLRTPSAVRASIVDLIEGRTSVKNTSDSIIIACITVDDVDLFKQKRSVPERVTALESVGLSKEFCGAFDAIVAFAPLSSEAFRSLVIKAVRTASGRLRDKGIRLEVTPVLIDHLTATLYDERYGARELEHSVTRAIEEPVARALLSGSIRKGEQIELVAASEDAANAGLIAKIR